MWIKEQNLKVVSPSRMQRNHDGSNNVSSFMSLWKLVILSVFAASLLFPNYAQCDFIVEEIENELTEGNVALNRWKRLLQDDEIQEAANDGKINPKSVEVQPVDEENGEENPKRLEETINKETNESNYYEKYKALYNNSDPKYAYVIEETNQYYCEKYGKRHLLCALNENVEDRKYVERYANDSDIDFILRFITRLRKRLLMGKEDGAGSGILPKASKMRRIQWSQELQIFAQRISNQCDNKLDNDLVISTDDIPTLTTLIGYAENSENRKPKWIQVLMQWYKGVKNVDPDIIFKAGKKMDSYSAMVWSTTYALGCGYTACESEQNGKVNKYYACLFGPAGNVEGKKIYEIEKEGTVNEPQEHSGEFALEGEVQEESDEGQNNGQESESAPKQEEEEERKEPVKETKSKNPFKLNANAKANKQPIKEKVSKQSENRKPQKINEFERKETRKAIVDSPEDGPKMFRKVGSGLEKGNPNNGSGGSNNTGNTTTPGKATSTSPMSINVYAIFLFIILHVLYVFK